MKSHQLTGYISTSVCIPALALFLSFFHPFNSGPALAESPHAGRWVTNHGQMRIHTAEQGKLVGTYFVGGTPAQLYLSTKGEQLYEGVWIQAKSEEPCIRKAKGSNHWGRVRFLFTGKKFFGLWNYCGKALTREPNRLWEGILKKRFGVPAEDDAAQDDLPPRLNTKEIFEKLVASATDQNDISITDLFAATVE